MADALIRAADIAVTPAADEAHLLLHCEPHDAPAIAAAAGLALPAEMLRGGEQGGWHALHLAPDEWLLIGDPAAAAALTASLARIGSTHPLSLVDISDRSLAYDLVGPAVETVLAAGCPMDLAMAAFPVGACSRTLFGKAMVMLWRTGEQAVRLEAARSFADYVVALLTVASEERR